MIIGKATNPEGKTLIFVGLSYMNVKLLMEGKPIVRDLNEAIDFNGELFIAVSETEEKMLEHLKKIAPDADIKEVIE